MAKSTSVADALFGKTRQAVLALLFGNPDREYYVREIVHAVAKGASQVQKELEGLAQGGLIVRRARANLVFHKANPEAAIFRELVAIVAKTFGISDVVRTALAKVERVRFAFIYGSVARNEHHATSDVDVLIVGDVMLSELEGPLHAAEKKLGRTIAPTVLGPKEFTRRRTEGDHFLRSVLAKPKIFLIGGPDSLRGEVEGRAD